MGAGNDEKSVKLLAEHQTWQWALPPALVVAATFIAYVATLAFGFVYDDHILVVRNDAIHSWRYLPSYFTSHIWSFWYPHMLSNAYRPLLLIWLRLNDAVFGLRTWGWHLTSVLVHVAAAYLVYRLGLRLTRDTWLALACGLVFGLHPVHLEVVACVSGVDFTLSTLFVLAAVLTWWRSREPGGKFAWLAASMGFAAAALLTKESSLMLPVVVGGIAWIWAGQEGKRLTTGERLRAALVGAAPFLAVTLAYLPLRVWALRGFVHPVSHLARTTALLTVPSAALFYLRLLVWPSRLSCYYDVPYVSSPTLRGFVLPLAAILVVLGGLVMVYRRLRARLPGQGRALAVAIFWSAAFLAPALNLRLLPEGEIVHDRYLYLPSVGFAILVGIALRQAWTRIRSRVRPVLGVAAAVAACALMGYAAVSQSLYWADDLSLNFHAHEVAPQNVDAMASLGAAVAARGMDAAAVTLYKQALQVRPDLWRANVNLAYIYYQHGDFAEAVHYFERSCASDPTDGDQFFYLGLAALQINRTAEAEAAMRTALLVRPQGKGYHLGLGMVLKQKGKLLEAKKEIETDLADDPRNARARALLEEIGEQRQVQPKKPLSGWSRKTETSDAK